jgi:hypothetical protein
MVSARRSYDVLPCLLLTRCRYRRILWHMLYEPEKLWKVRTETGARSHLARTAMKTDLPRAVTLCGERVSNREAAFHVRAADKVSCKKCRISCLIQGEGGFRWPGFK